MKIYTKTGDDGSTGLQGSKRIMKSNIRIKAYGAVDEINASIGLILSSRLEDGIEKLFKKIQSKLKLSTFCSKSHYQNDFFARWNFIDFNKNIVFRFKWSSHVDGFNIAFDRSGPNAQ